MRTIFPVRATRAPANGSNHGVGTPGATGVWNDAEPVTSGRRLGRRSAPHLVLGMLLVVGCAVGFLVVSLPSGDRVSVLVTARAVTVGQVLTARDLRAVDLPAQVDVRAVGAARAAELVGRPVAVSLPAGALLTPESVGGGAAPPAGQAIVALALEVGRIPPELKSGSSVAVVAVPDRAAAGASQAPPRSWPAVVTGVAPAGSASTSGSATVVSVRLDETAARAVAALPAGQISVVLVAAGG